MKLADKVKTIGESLPPPAMPAANYVPYVREGGLLVISGQLPFMGEKKEHVGRLGDNFTLAQGQAAARACALNILAQLNEAIGGDLSVVKQCLRLGGFVRAVPEFAEHPAVMNGASDLIGSVLGKKGRHARFAVGVASLPFEAAVEIDALFLLNK